MRYRVMKDGLPVVSTTSNSVFSPQNVRVGTSIVPVEEQKNMLTPVSADMKPCQVCVCFSCPCNILRSIDLYTCTVHTWCPTQILTDWRVTSRVQSRNEVITVQLDDIMLISKTFVCHTWVKSKASTNQRWNKAIDPQGLVWEYCGEFGWVTNWAEEYPPK